MAANDRVHLLTVKPTVPFSQMTDEQRREFAREVAAEMKRRYAIAMAAAKAAEEQS